MTTTVQEDLTIVISRVFNAPRDLVFNAFYQPENIAHWWGPEGLNTRVDAFDFQIGGRWAFVMVSPDGKEYPAEGKFLEIDPPRKVVSTDEFGECMPVSEELKGIISTTEFEELGNQTKVTITLLHRSIEGKKQHARMGVIAGWQSSFDCLSILLAQLQNKPVPLSPSAEREMVIIREVNAPRELVFKVWSDPLHLAKWFGPDGFTITTDEMKFVSGGHWIFTMHGPDGTDYRNFISYFHIEHNKMLVYSQGGGEEFEPGNFNVIIKFEDAGINKTKVTSRMIFNKPEDRTLVEQKYGAVEGGLQCYERLDRYASDLAQELPHTFGVMLTDEKTVVIRRKFKAPAGLVYKVWTDSQKLNQWFTCDKVKLTDVASNLSVGGKYKYVMTSPDGGKCSLSGEYLEIIPGKKLVYLERFSGNPDSTKTITVKFDQHDTETWLTCITKFDSVESRDAAVNLGVLDGTKDSLNRLEKFLHV